MAGTNGKGSICRYLYCALQAAGYKTGLYISPYIEVFNERIEAGGSYISDEDLGEMMVFAKKVAQAIKASIPCQKVGVTVIGLEVRHAHIHLIPMQKEGDMDFSKKTTFPDDVMKATAEEIQKNFNA